MNRIVLIGNGFDLAHGLKTQYQHFIDKYWEQRLCSLGKEGRSVSNDHLCSFELNTEHRRSWSGWCNEHIRYNAPQTIDDIWDILKLYSDVCKVIKSPLLDAICRSLKTNKNWVDIEDEYYELLKTYIFNEKLTPETKKQRVNELNEQLAIIQQYLIDYLSSLPHNELSASSPIRDSLFAPISVDEISIECKEWFEEYIQSKLDGKLPDIVQNILQYNVPKTNVKNLIDGISAIHINKKEEAKAWLGDYEMSLLALPNQILFLNFNYTDTIDLYCPKTSNYFKVNHIHGTLDKPESVIFGYGDELDEKYKAIQDKNINDYLCNIKSIRYLESDNYRKMLQFIESDKFQVYIVGHSCGNSDRTLLNTIFEHKNCISIKPFYYTRDDGTDNYLELVQNISRNFTDMKLMRDRVVNKTYCKEITK